MGIHPVTSGCVCVCVCLCTCGTPLGFGVFEVCRRLANELNYEFLQHHCIAHLREESWVGCKIKLTTDIHRNSKKTSPCSLKKGVLVLRRWTGAVSILMNTMVFSILIS